VQTPDNHRTLQERFKKSKPFWQALSPSQTILTGFVVLAVADALLLWLPRSSVAGARQPFLDALFVASSAVSTTGLSVVDIGSAYSIFGQVVVLLLFQIGGLGYMTFFAFFALAFRRKLSFRSGQTVQETLSAPSRGEVLQHVKKVVLFTAVFELSGAITLSLYWLRSFPLPQALYLGIFHSVSTFCTAGFSLFTDNLAGYQGDLTIGLALSVLSICGAIGFLVLSDVQLYADKAIRGVRPKRLLIHSKVSLLLFHLPVPGWNDRHLPGRGSPARSTFRGARACFLFPELLGGDDNRVQQH
jgi:trk system potassium uptake protein TrkH